MGGWWRKREHKIRWRKLVTDPTIKENKGFVKQARIDLSRSDNGGIKLMIKTFVYLRLLWTYRLPYFKDYIYNQSYTN